MRINFKNGHESARISIDHADDLWILSSVVSPGDHVSGMTERKIKVAEDKPATRKRVKLEITVEKVEFTGDTLRILGTITNGPEDVPRGEHHSFVLEQGSDVTITKEWAGYEIAKLKQATKREAPLLVLLFDREEGRLYEVTRRGIQELTRIKGKVAKKAMEQEATNFFKELMELLQQYASRGYGHIIAGAPAFWREYLQKELPEELRKKTVMTTISDVEQTAIRELLSRPEVQKVMKESTMMRELQLVEKVMEALAKEKLAYGMKEIAEVATIGNASQIIVTEEKIRESQVQQLVKQAEQTKAEVHVLTVQESIDKLEPLGGIVALKRW